MKFDDQHLINSIKDGNKEMWDELVRELYKPLLSFVYSYVKEVESAEELVQDVFVNFWVKKEKIEITGSLKSYLFRAARNHTLNFLKRKKFEQEYQKGLANEITVQKNETEDAYQFAELQKKLAEAIENLPDSSREMFKMSRFSDMTYKEIADALDVPVRTVHYQIGLALKELRESLRGHVSNDNLINMVLLAGTIDVMAQMSEFIQQSSDYASLL